MKQPRNQGSAPVECVQPLIYVNTNRNALEIHEVNMALLKNTLYCAHCDKDHKITTVGDTKGEIYKNGKVIGHYVSCWAYCPARGSETINGQVNII